MPVSIVAEGGGFRAAYVTGVMQALYAHFGLKRADVVTGTSAAAPIMAFYASGQFPSCYEGWWNDIPSPRMCSFSNLLRGRPYVDVDYLVDVIIRNLTAFDKEALRQSPMQLVLPVTSCATGHHEFIDVQKSPFDTFEILRAAMSIPIVYHKPTRLGDEYYVDSQMTDPLGLENPHIAGTRKIIILTRPLSYTPHFKRAFETRIFKPFLSPVAYRLLRESGDKRAKAIETCKQLAARGDIIVAPANDRGRVFDNSAKSIHRLIREGFEDALNHQGLQRLIADLRTSPQADFYFPDEQSV